MENSTTRARRGLDLDQLRQEVESGQIDTVVVGITDMQGRLVGKKLQADFFMEEIVPHGTEGCNYLLAADVEMNTVSGYAMSSWERGYGDFMMIPDMSTLRYVPWQEKTAMLLADVQWEDGSDVVASPRQILRRQIRALEEQGLKALVGTELEFIVFMNSYEDAWRAGYREMTPANLYNVDYSLLGVSRIEELLREIRTSMAGASMRPESIKGECNFGQHEIAFRYDEALATCDNHVIYKLGAKEIAAKQGKSLTFMAKYNEREGNSCHTHLSVRSLDGKAVMAEGGSTTEFSRLGRQFVAGIKAHMAELTLMFAPNINSYKRFVEGSFAPTAIEWGRDNRTCALRVVGHGQSLRVENRAPGGDANPYLVVSAMIAAGLDGIKRGLELGPAFEGNAYRADTARIPSSLERALALWNNSPFVGEAFGEEVQEHYANMAKVEIDAFAAAVTDWERYRSFERM
ncbi:MAG: glutamine synthetase family protein [Actinomycetota bacterium]|nr:glutamine synthetase family protein [Actinomycetota bacterium]